MGEAVRLGVLGTAWITPTAILKPAKEISTVDVVAVAARDPERAKRYANKHGIPKVHANYEELLADPGVDAVYVPLPNSLHAAWSLRALDAGKHVLCEKPMAANAQEAELMSDAAERSGRVLAEAMHYRYHPFAQRIREIFQEGALGKLLRLEAYACFPIFRGTDIRYSFPLGGGATMDLGCYAIHLLRTITGEEPTVTRATATLYRENVDRRMEAELLFPSGATARMVCSLWSKDFLKGNAWVEGERGKLVIENPLAPQLMHALKWIKDGKQFKKEHLKGTKSTSYYQLVAFADAILRGTPMLTGPADAVANLRVLDAIYDKAGLPRRGGRSAITAAP